MSAVTGGDNLPQIRQQVVFPGFGGEPETVVTTTAADGSLRVEYSLSGLVVTASFLPNGSIVEIFGPPLNYSRVTSFGADTITEVLA
jgi:hypothetical protein